MKKRRKKLRCCWGSSEPSHQCKVDAAFILVRIKPSKGERHQIPMCAEHYVEMAELITIGKFEQAMRAAVKEVEDEKETRH